MNYTDEELELLVKYAARDQRYACVDEMICDAQGDQRGAESKIQNTPCPDPKEVIVTWRADLAKHERPYSLPPQPRPLGDMDYGVNVVVFGLIESNPTAGVHCHRILRNHAASTHSVCVQSGSGSVFLLPKDTPCYPKEEVGDAG